MKMEIDEIEALLEVAKAYAPEIDKATEALLNGYGPILGKVFESARQYMTESTHKTIQQYKEYGYSKKESILLALNTKMVLRDVIQEMSDNKAKNKK